MSANAITQVRGLLVATPVPNDRETAIGYVLRLTQANGYRAPTLFIPKEESGKLAMRGGSARMLQSVAGLSTDQAQRLAIIREPEGYRFLGHLLKTRELVLDHHRICPACIEEDGIFDASWHLSCTSHCARHGLPLMDHCEACNAGLSLVRPGVGICRCQWLLMCNLRSPPCSPQLRALMQAIRARLFKNSAIAKPVQTLPHFNGLDLPQFLTVVRALHKHVARQRGHTVGDRRMNASAMEVVARTMHAFKKGLRAVQAALHNGKVLMPGNGPGSQGAFDWYYDRQYDLRSIPELAFVGNAIAAAARGESDQFMIPACVASPVLAASSAEERKKPERNKWETQWVRLEELATQTGCTVSGLQRAVELKFIRGGIKRPDISVLHRDELARLMPSRHPGLSAEHAAGFLGISPRFLEWLCASQNLSAVHIPGSGGPYAIEDVHAAKALFRSAHGRVLISKPRMTLACFLNADPHVQITYGSRAIQAMERPECSVPNALAHLPPIGSQSGSGKRSSLLKGQRVPLDPAKALVSRSWRSNLMKQLAEESVEEPSDTATSALAPDEPVSNEFLLALADQLCRENVAKRLRRHHGTS